MDLRFKTTKKVKMSKAYSGRLEKDLDNILTASRAV